LTDLAVVYHERASVEKELLLERAGWLDAQPPVEIGWRTHLASGTVASMNQTP